MSKPQVLNLDAELQRSEVTFKGGKYELRNKSELSILEAHNLSTLLHEFDGLDAKGSEEAASRTGELLQTVAALLVVDPPEGGFPDQACAAILSFWTDQNPAPDPPTPPRAAPRDRQPKKKTTSTRSTGAR